MRIGTTELPGAEGELVYMDLSAEELGYPDSIRKYAAVDFYLYCRSSRGLGPRRDIRMMPLNTIDTIIDLFVEIPLLLRSKVLY